MKVHIVVKIMSEYETPDEIVKGKCIFLVNYVICCSRVVCVCVCVCVCVYTVFL